MFGLRRLLKKTIFGEKPHVILLTGLTFLSLINAAGPVNINDTTFTGKLVEIKKHKIPVIIKVKYIRKRQPLRT